MASKDMSANYHFGNMVAGGNYSSLVAWANCCSVFDFGAKLKTMTGLEANILQERHFLALT